MTIQLTKVSLDDKYTLDTGRVYLSGRKPLFVCRSSSASVTLRPDLTRRGLFRATEARHSAFTTVPYGRLKSFSPIIILSSSLA
jgi:hypothetical protein